MKKFKCWRTEFDYTWKGTRPSDASPWDAQINGFKGTTREEFLEWYLKKYSDVDFNNEFFNFYEEGE